MKSMSSIYYLLFISFTSEPPNDSANRCITVNYLNLWIIIQIMTKVFIRYPIIPYCKKYYDMYAGHAKNFIS